MLPSSRLNLATPISLLSLLEMSQSVTGLNKCCVKASNACGFQNKRCARVKNGYAWHNGSLASGPLNGMLRRMWLHGRRSWRRCTVCHRAVLVERERLLKTWFTRMTDQDSESLLSRRLQPGSQQRENGAWSGPMELFIGWLDGGSFFKTNMVSLHVWLA